VLGTKKIPYAMEAIEIKLKEIAVASGAPIKPRAKDSGPHTGAKVKVSANLLRHKGRPDTKKVVKDHVDGRNNDNNLGWNRKETL
jgi:hypothetical protein